MQTPEEAFMKMAISEAVNALEEDEVPVGCIIVSAEGSVIGRAHNQRETLRDPTAHAEIIAITQAAAAFDSWRLDGATCFVTLEPCAMCAGALVLSRVARVVFGAWDPKAGAAGSVLDVLSCKSLNHNPEVTGGVMAEDCGTLLTEFFRKKRWGRK